MPSQMDPVYPPKAKRARRSSAGFSLGRDWNQCMDGFEGCAFGLSQHKTTKRNARKSLPPSLVQFGRTDLESDDILISPTPVEIEWTQSDEEDGLPFDSQMQPESKQDDDADEDGYNDQNSQTDTKNTKDDIMQMLSSPQSQALDHLTISSCESTSSRNCVKAGQVSWNKHEYRNEPISPGQSPPISCEATPPKQTQGTAATSSRTTSHWMQGLQWQSVTPEKSPGILDTSGLAESVRKKRTKYISGGLAEKLQRLLSREKTAKALWTHKTRNSKGAKMTTQRASNKVLTVRIESCSVSDSLLKAKCYSMTDVKNLESESVVPGDTTPKLVLFNEHQAKELGISPGSLVQIHPPWQTLKNSDGEDVILCTQYCLTLKPGKPAGLAEDTDEMSFNRVIATWSCPCVNGHMNSTNCVAQVKAYIPEISSLMSNRKLEGNMQQNQEVEVTHNLQVVTSTPVTENKPHLEQSILDSIAQCGGCEATGIAFCAVVQRVYRRKVDKSMCWCLLVQDIYGAFSEIQLPNENKIKDGCEKSPYTDIQGRELRFTGLKVAQRITREKFSALFSLLDTLWKPEKYAKKIDSQDSCGSTENGFQNESVGPGFCYSLTSENSYHEHLEKPLGDHSKLYCKPEVVTMAALLKKGNLGKYRSTLIGKIVYKYDIKDAGALFYVTDASMGTDGQENREKGSDLPCTCQCLTLTKDVDMDVDLLTVGTVCYLQDVMCHKCILEADAFSTIRPLSPTCDFAASSSLVNISINTLAALQPPLPPFQEVHATYSLVTLKGVVRDVDEESAYTWTECDCCGSSDLVSHHGANMFLFCQHCQRGVTEPVTKMKLQVYLTNDIPHCKFKVELLQPTIEALLPEEADDEGYELQAVLGKSIGPLNCLVLSTSQKKDNKEKEIFLTEIKYPP